MGRLVRLIIGLALAVVVVSVALVLVKLVVGVAILGAVAFGAMWVVHFIAAFARRLNAAGQTAPPAMLGR